MNITRTILSTIYIYLLFYSYFISFIVHKVELRDMLKYIYREMDEISQRS